MLKHAMLAAALVAAVPASAAAPPQTREGVDLVALSHALIPAVVNITILKQRPDEKGDTREGAEAMTTPITEVGSGFVIDPAGMVAWSHVSPIGVNPGADGILRALEDLAQQRPEDLARQRPAS